MDEASQQHGAECTGRPNPHYRPPVMRWNAVEVIAPEGLEFGICHDGDGLLGVAVRLPGQDWPDGMKPDADSVKAIKPGEVSFFVKNDDRGPAVGHEFQPDPESPGDCLVCKVEDPLVVGV